MNFENTLNKYKQKLIYHDLNRHIKPIRNSYQYFIVIPVLNELAGSNTIEADVNKASLNAKSIAALYVLETLTCLSIEDKIPSGTTNI